ncbi:MAG TPA: hypothetical protein VIT92_17590, partial [Burkholderiaceae bacterium]
MFRYALILAAAIALLAMLNGCGGGGAGNPVIVDPVPQVVEPAPLAYAVAGEAVIKARALDRGWVGMAEKLQPLSAFARPERRLLLSLDRGTPGYTYSPPAGWSLIDFAAHAAGPVSAVLANDTQLRLVRLNGLGQVVSQTDFTDAQAALDPYVGDRAYIRNAQSLLPFLTRDAVRLAAVGNDLVVALHTGLNVVVAYRYNYSTDLGYRQQWRTVVEPGAMVGARFVTSGSYDPFAGLDHQFRVLLDADANGRVAVAVSVRSSEYAEA